MFAETNTKQDDITENVHQNKGNFTENVHKTEQYHQYIFNKKPPISLIMYTKQNNFKAENVC